MPQQTLRESFYRAFTGMWRTVRLQRNSRIQLLLGVFALVLGWLFELSVHEFAILILACTVVGVAEIMNTALEQVSDLVKPRAHPLVETIKDASAAAVLLAAFGALCVVTVLFFPRLATLINIQI